MRNEEVKFNWRLMLSTIIFSAAAWFASELLRDKLGIELSHCILVGICFAATGLIIGVSVFIKSIVGDSFEANVITGRNTAGAVLAYILIGTIVLFGVGTLAEYVYEQNFKKLEKITAYVFVIDDSGSMQRNDENLMRYEAVNELLDSCEDDFPYVVYSFSDKITLSGVGKASERSVEFDTYGGMTNIRGALETVLNDYNNATWDGGTNPRFVLLTDGYATDVKYYSDLDTVLGGYAKKGLTVSCVGMSEADQSLLEYISDATGGVTVNAENVDELASAMTTAAKSIPARDLFSYRRGVKLDYVYAIIRVLAITILGTLIGILTAICYGVSDYAKNIIIIGACKSLVAGLVLELGINTLDISDMWCWLAAWVIMCTVFTQRKFKKLTFNNEQGSMFI